MASSHLICGLAMLMLLGVHGAAAQGNGTCEVNTANGKPGWGRTCAFPYEGCATNPQTARYTASATRYFQNKAGLWTQCMQIVVLDKGTCEQRAGFPRNVTRCCDTMLNKLKLDARRECWGSVASYTVNGTAPRTSFVWEKAGPSKSKTIVKFTPLKLTPATADGVEICFSLRAPCATMDTFTKGKDLIYSLYDKKVSTTFKGVKSRAYECCPTSSVVVNKASRRRLVAHKAHAE